MSGAGRKILVWDIPVRVFHWLVVALVPAAYITSRSNSPDWHAWTGEALLALLLFRILLGCFGSQTARFSGLLVSPVTVWQHLTHLLRREPDREAGHNPAGGWMVLLLLALLLAEVLTGLFINNDVADVGPFTDLVPAAIANAITTLHAVLWDAILVAVTLHVLALTFYAVVKRQNLVLPMITGWKTLPDAEPQPRTIGLGRAIVLFGCSALAAAAMANFL